MFGMKLKTRLPYSRKPISANRMLDEAKIEGETPCSCTPVAQCVRQDEKPYTDGGWFSVPDSKSCSSSSSSHALSSVENAIDKAGRGEAVDMLMLATP